MGSDHTRRSVGAALALFVVRSTHLSVGVALDGPGRVRVVGSFKAVDHDAGPRRGGVDQLLGADVDPDMAGGSGGSAAAVEGDDVTGLKVGPVARDRGGAGVVSLGFGLLGLHRQRLIGVSVPA